MLFPRPLLISQLHTISIAESASHGTKTNNWLFFFFFGTTLFIIKAFVHLQHCVNKRSGNPSCINLNTSYFWYYKQDQVTTEPCGSLLLGKPKAIYTLTKYNTHARLLKNVIYSLWIKANMFQKELIVQHILLQIFARVEPVKFLFIIL